MNIDKFLENRLEAIEAEIEAVQKLTEELRRGNESIQETVEEIRKAHKELTDPPPTSQRVLDHRLAQVPSLRKIIYQGSQIDEGDYGLF